MYILSAYNDPTSSLPLDKLIIPQALCEKKFYSMPFQTSKALIKNNAA